MTEELKPCPFCGPGGSVVSVYFDDSSRRYRVGCGACGCSSGIHPRDKTPAPAIEAWNRRTGEVPDFALLGLLADIRKAAGDQTGKLMQDELVEHIAALREDAERWQWVAKQARMDPDMGGNHRWHSIYLRGDVRGATLDAAIDAARSAHVEQEQG